MPCFAKILIKIGVFRFAVTVCSKKEKEPVFSIDFHAKSIDSTGKQAVVL